MVVFTAELGSADIRVRDSKLSKNILCSDERGLICEASFDAREGLPSRDRTLPPLLLASRNDMQNGKRKTKLR